MYLTFTYRFNAFHRMWNRELTTEENNAAFGKCSNPSGHGHAYIVEVTVRGRADERAPFVLGRGDIEAIKRDLLDPILQGKDMEELVGEKRVSSGENIASAVRELLSDGWNYDAELVLVGVRETRKNRFTWANEKAIRRGMI